MEDMGFDAAVEEKVEDKGFDADTVDSTEDKVKKVLTKKWGAVKTFKITKNGKKSKTVMAELENGMKLQAHIADFELTRV